MKTWFEDFIAGAVVAFLGLCAIFVACVVLLLFAAMGVIVYNIEPFLLFVYIPVVAGMFYASIFSPDSRWRKKNQKIMAEKESVNSNDIWSKKYHKLGSKPE